MIDQEVNRKLRERGVASYLLDAGREGLVSRWRTFVIEIEDGYRLGLDDYCNDLDIRQIIEGVGLGDDPEVKELDRRFAAQMQHTERTVWVSEYPNAFWIRGYPLRLSPSMAEDLGV